MTGGNDPGRRRPPPACRTMELMPRMEEEEDEDERERKTEDMG